MTQARPVMLGHDGGVTGDSCHVLQPAIEPRPDNGPANEAIADIQQAFCMQHRHAGGTPRAGRAAVHLARVHHNRIAPGRHAGIVFQRHGELAE